MGQGLCGYGKDQTRNNNIPTPLGIAERNRHINEKKKKKKKRKKKKVLKRKIINTQFHDFKKLLSRLPYRVVVTHILSFLFADIYPDSAGRKGPYFLFGYFKRDPLRTYFFLFKNVRFMFPDQGNSIRFTIPYVAPTRIRCLSVRQSSGLVRFFARKPGQMTTLSSLEIFGPFESVDYGRTKFVYPNLKSINIDSVFSSQRVRCHFPNLEYLAVNECINFEIYPGHKLKTFLVRIVRMYELSLDHMKEVFTRSQNLEVFSLTCLETVVFRTVLSSGWFLDENVNPLTKLKFFSLCNDTFFRDQIIEVDHEIRSRFFRIFRRNTLRQIELMGINPGWEFLCIGGGEEYDDQRLQLEHLSVRTYTDFFDVFNVKRTNNRNQPRKSKHVIAASKSVKVLQLDLKNLSRDELKSLNRLFIENEWSKLEYLSLSYYSNLPIDRLNGRRWYPFINLKKLDLICNNYGVSEHLFQVSSTNTSKGTLFPKLEILNIDVRHGIFTGRKWNSLNFRKLRIFQINIGELVEDFRIMDLPRYTFFPSLEILQICCHSESINQWRQGYGDFWNPMKRLRIFKMTENLTKIFSRNKAEKFISEGVRVILLSKKE